MPHITGSVPSAIQSSPGNVRRRQCGVRDQCGGGATVPVVKDEGRGVKEMPELRWFADNHTWH